jgi:hypothetical protein
MPKLILLPGVAVEWTDTGCRTTFEDGAQTDSWPHDTAHYHVVAHRCGYGDDILAYCREHDACHVLLARRLMDMHSPVLWAQAHGEPVAPGLAAIEELTVQSFQAWLRASQRPIVGEIDWDGLRSEALALLG